MANKSHQMTMPDSHFNSGMILCRTTLQSIDFFFLRHRGNQNESCCWHRSCGYRTSRLTQAPHLSLCLASSHLRLIHNGLFTVLSWQPLHLHPQTSSLCKNITHPSPHLSTSTAILFWPCLQLDFKVTPLEKWCQLNCQMLVKNSQIKYRLNQMNRKNTRLLRIRNVL